ncbi:hypothetical protein BDQ17DRAFT_1195982, partial [Cyathus striatus]
SIYLDELQEKLMSVCGVEASISTISRALCRLAISHKNVAVSALERNEQLCATWQAVNGQIPMEYIVWIDEAAVDDHTNQWSTG